MPSATLKMKCIHQECCSVTALDAPSVSHMQVQEQEGRVMLDGICLASLSLCLGNPEELGIALTAQRLPLHWAKGPTSLLQLLELT